MNPNDGFGCGRSIVWEYKSVEVAKKIGEACPCIDYKTIIIKMTPNSVKDQCSVKIQISCPNCPASYEETSKKMTEKFLKFYGK